MHKTRLPSPGPFYGLGPAAQPGAAGRFNRPGEPALYLAGDVATARAQHGLAKCVRFRAGIELWQVRVALVADFRPAELRAWGRLWQAWACDWRALHAAGEEPPTWRMADQVRNAGLPGLRYPALHRPGGSLLVLWPDRLLPSEWARPGAPEAGGGAWSAAS